ncbi:CadC family transcriptional regulator [Serratia plymuthica]|uniref:CadC family transcriptional regulator n=1 Tax=Serratia plymuthica S13 TaxID=1348660 RepID=S4YPR4_SERPL|nr:winged helix-turn-helix domain-containing protein [Serratia plymuthica]AGP46496.1 CadC family transcriptional regulator [Serratia plymuthica S13]KYG17290.1 DNA-binding transcriptional activator CadC [Serratia plymuthica]MBI6140046.1 winged helix-turn-helix domain-containing protein [Serratia plymuthica]NIC28695.1 CadC family transcriptional regulator [Serratia plymuthica]QPS86245.1 winged helix-turn-helix domain-containing protein [Serratia plymuthica]
MIFVINKNIKYNEYEGTLENIDDPGNTILLVKPACRLLSIFVRNNDMLIKRKQLLDEVWEDYGLKATDSNLNNYISGLRRSLAKFDEEELIITYPRQGFKFTAKKIVRQEANAILSEPDIMIELEQKEDIRPDGHKEEQKRTNLWLKKTTLQKMAVITVILLLPFFLSMAYKQIPVSNITNLGHYKNCDIYSIKYNGMQQKEIENMISNRYSCEDKANVYYYFNIKEKSVSSHASLIAYCPLDIATSCEISYIKG